MNDKVDDVAVIDAQLDDLGAGLPGRCEADLRRGHVERGDDGLPSRRRTVRAHRRRRPGVWHSGVGDRPAETPGVGPALPRHEGRVHPIHGRKGAKSIFGTNYRPVEDSIRAWVKANGCDETPKTDMLADGGDGLRVTRQTYSGGRDGSEVALVVVEGGGHTWPRKKPTALVLGRSTLTVSANDLMWEFFQKHPMA